jgi:hypothetical protein
VLVGRAANGEDVLTLAIADLNGDGRSDLALFDGWFVRILLGRGDGTFKEPIDTWLERMPGSTTHYNSSGILIADFNRDRRPDIASRSNVMLGNGDGAFQPPRFFLDISTAKGTYPHPWAAADLNGDGNLDVVIVYAEGTLSVFSGKGDGTLSRSAEYESIGGLVVSVDVDGDDRCDLVGANRFSNMIFVLMNQSAWPR